ncbi:MAG: hypothetical protein K5925_04660 [Bacilli bacterium]|nr:hypothetical protein [Bacilli bacterium]
MKHLIILNAKAGAFKDLDAFKKEVDEKFKGLDYELYFTPGPRAVIPYLHEYLTKNKDKVRVYACGGDGTVHEVVNGLIGHPNAELAVLAVGTGNDFVKIYSEEKDWDNIVTNKTGENRFKDFSKLINGTVVEIDISKVTGPSLPEPWYSNNVVNFGFDAIVGAKGNENKSKGKKNPYGPAAIIPAIMGGRFNKIIVKADGEQLDKKRMLLASLAQGQWVGGQYHASPKSDNTDGLIDVVVLKCMSLARLMIQYFGPYTKGEHLSNEKLLKRIVYRKAKVVEMNSAKPFDICVDGEILKGTEFKVEVMPKALKFVVPAK